MIYPRRRCLRGALFAMLCAVAGSAYAGFYEGVGAYKDGDHQLAFEHMEPLAKMGHVQSQFLVAVMHYRGEGIAKNMLLGYGWMKLAAEGGHEQAKELLPKLEAQMSDEQIGAAEDLVGAFTSDALNERLLPRILASGEYQSMTAPKVITAEKPDYPAKVRQLHLSGLVVVELTIASDGTVRDTRVVYSLAPTVLVNAVLAVAPGWKFSPALKEGEPTTALHTSKITFTTEGDSARKLQKHDAEIRQKAVAGDPVSQYAYAVTVAGRMEKQWSQALPFITQAAQAGLVPAQFELGQSLLMGRGCEQDPSKAMHWLQLAAEQGDANAQLSLARIALTPGATLDQDKALVWLQQAANQEHVRARKYLAAIFAASDDARVRHPTKALELLDTIAPRNREEPTTYEIRAAALANSGDFAGAVRAQESAVSRAQALGWDTVPMKERLTRYQAKQGWLGNLML